MIEYNEQKAWTTYSLEHDARLVTRAAAEAIDYARTDGVHVVCGIVSMEDEHDVMLRLHVPGRGLFDDSDPFTYVRSRVHAAVAAVDLTSWRVVDFDVEPTACIVHDECEANPEMGRLCWRSARGERT